MMALRSSRPALEARSAWWRLVAVLLVLAGWFAAASRAAEAAGPDERVIVPGSAALGPAPAEKIFGQRPGDDGLTTDRPLPAATSGAASGALYLEPEAVPAGDRVRVRGRLRAADEDGAVGVALVEESASAWAVAGTLATADGHRLALWRSDLAEAVLAPAGSWAPASGEWFELEMELAATDDGFEWRVRAWPEGAARPEEAAVVAGETAARVVVGRPAVWVSGPGEKRVAALDVEVATSLKGERAETPQDWTLTAEDGHLVVRSGGEVLHRVPLAADDLPGPSPEREPAGPLLKSAGGECDAYRYRFAGVARGYPTSSATLRLPPRDNDCDGSFNEDPINWRDDDGDGLVDEDPFGVADLVLDWRSNDPVIGDFAPGDHPAAFLLIRRCWPRPKLIMGFATVYGWSEPTWLVGSAQVSPYGRGTALLSRSRDDVKYDLEPAPPELAVTILESGAPLDDLSWFDRPAVLDARVENGTGEVALFLRVDDVEVQPGVEVSEEGSYRVVAEASDTTGATVLAARTFGIDLTPPVVAITGPEDGAVIPDETVTVSGTVDEPNLAGLSVNGLFATVSGGAFTVTGVPVGEDETVLTATARDLAGHVSEASITVRRGSPGPPLLTMDAPQPTGDSCFAGGSTHTFAGTYTSSKPTSGSDGQPAPLVLGVVTSDGASASYEPVVTPGATSWSLDGVPLGDGDGIAVATATATDADGQRTVVSRSFRIDGAPPVLTLTLDGAPFPGAAAGDTPPPSAGPTLFARAVGVRAGVADGALGAPPPATMTLDGAPYAAGTPITTEGEHLVTAAATDCAGHTASAHAFFAIDLSPPQLLSIDPEDGALLAQGVGSIEGVADSALASASVNGSAAGISGETFSLSPFSWREGANELAIVLTDAAGNSASYTRRFTVDTLAPEVEILVDGLPVPAAALFTRAVALEVRCSDPEAALTATLDGAAYVSGTPVASSGAHTIEATATDALGRTATAAASFEIDLGGGPAIAISAPADGAVLTEPVATVTGTVEGRAPTVTVNGRPAAVEGTTWTLVDLPLDADTLNVITAGARDAAGRSASVSISVVVDTGAPQVVILEPADGLVTNRGRIDVAGFVVGGSRRTADGTATVAGTAVPVALDGAFRALDVPLAAGPNLLTASAEDSQGRVGETAVTVVSDLEPPLVRVLVGGQPLAEGDVFGGPIVLRVEVEDATGEPPPPEIRLNGSAVAAAGPVVELAVEEDGGYVLAVAAADLAGNLRRLQRSFSITGGGCALSDLQPSPGAVVAGDAVTIRGRSEGAESVAVRVPVAGTDPVQYQEYAAQLADGTFVAGDVPLPAAGDTTLVLACTDAVGGTALTELPIHRLDGGDGPVVEIVAPVDGAWTTARSIEVAGRVSDAAAAVTVNSLAAAVSDRGDGSADFLVTVPLAEGPNVLAARAVDATGRSGRDRVVVWLDTRAPALRIVRPESNSWLGPAADGAAETDVTGVVDLHAEPNLESVVVATAAGSVAAPVDPDSGVFTAAGVPLDPAAGADVLQTITATAADALGHTAASEVEVHFDASGPAIVLTAPPDLGRYTEASPVEIGVAGTAWAGDGAQVSVNGTTLDPLALEWTAAGARLQADLSAGVARPASEGAFAVVARVSELDGRWSGTRRLLYLDTTVPEVVETYPADGALEVDPNTLMLVLFSEPMRITSLSAPDGLVLTRIDTGDPVAVQLAVSGSAAALVAGAELAPSTDYRLRVGTDVVDLAGNALAAPAEVGFRTAAASGGARPVLDPLPAVVCGDSLTVRGSAPAHATVRVGDGTLGFQGAADSSGRFEIEVPLFADGYHLLTAAILDRFGAAGPAATAVVRVDCSAPAVRAVSFDPATAVIRIELSEAVDEASATIGAAGAAIRLFDAEDPAQTDRGGTVQAAEGGRVLEILLDSTQDAWWQDTVIRLVVDAPLADLQGNVMAAPFEARLFPSGGEGLSGAYLLGEAYDDAGGRPLAGARARLFAAGAALPGTVPPELESAPVAEAVTDLRGRYQMVDEVAAGRATLVLEAEGYAPVVRRLDLDPARGTVVFDARLTPLAAAAGTLDPVAGGRVADPDQPLLALEADPAAAPGTGELTAYLSPRSPQALPDFLPLGWTPLAAVDVRLEDASGALPDGEAAPFAPGGVRLELPLPDWVQPTDALLAVRYRLAGGAWLTLDEPELASGPAGEPLARVALVGPGSVAVVLADEGATAPPWPEPGAGRVLRGVELPTEMPELEGELELDPPVIPATGRSRALVVARSADGESPWPSGTAVQAYLEERLLLAGGGEVVESPFVADLLLYRPRLDYEVPAAGDAGSVGAVEFVVSPSERAASVLLDVGYENIALYPFPDALERGQVLGSGGGTVSSADGVELTLPEGALPSRTAVEATLLDADELAALSPVAGFDTLAAVRLDFGGQVLARRATLSLDTPAGTPQAVPGDPRLVLAELVEASADGRGSYAKLAARMSRIDGGGRLEAAPEATGSGLPLDGIVRESLYLVLSAQAPVAYATGFVRAPNGAGLTAARVTADGLGTADVAKLGGRYATVVPTAAGSELTALHPTLDERGTAPLPVLQPADIVILDITVSPVPPVLEGVEPAPEAAGVLVTTAVSVRLSKALDPTTVGPGTLTLVLADANGNPTGAVVSGAVSLEPGGTLVVFNSTLPLSPGRRYVARFSGAVTGAAGTPYTGGPYDWRFRTSDIAAPGGQIHPERFHIRLPVNGVAEVYGDPGALPTVPEGTTPWAVSPWVNSAVADPVRGTFSADSTGGFAGTVGHPPQFPITIESDVWVTVFDHNGDTAAEFRLGVFTTPDGRGFVAPPGESVEFTTADGVTVEVPEEAFDVPTVVRIETLDPATLGVEDDLGLAVGGALRIDFAGSAAESLTLRVPAPPDVAEDSLVLVGEPVAMAWGRRLQLVTLGGVVTDESGSYLTNDPAVQPSIPDLREGGLKAASNPEIFIALRKPVRAVWYYEPTTSAKSSHDINLATFMSGGIDGILDEVFYNPFYPAWVYRPPAEGNWSGQVVLPTPEGAPFSVERRDAATGWLLSSQTYGIPLDDDGDGVVPLETLLPPDPGPPLLVSASPFDVIRMTVSEPGTTQRLRLDLEAEVTASGMVRLESPPGFEISQRAGVGLYDVSEPPALAPLVGPGFVCSENVLGAERSAGASLMVVVGPGTLDAASLGAFSFTFSRATDDLPGATPANDVARLFDLGSFDGGACGGTAGEQVELDWELRANRRTLVLRPLTALSAGHSYRLELETGTLFGDSCGTPGDNAPCAAPRRLFFSTREVSDEPIATGGQTGLDDARTLARIGNLLFIGTSPHGVEGNVVPGGVFVTDLSGGDSASGLGFVPHARMSQGAVENVRAFATDDHGRLFFNAQSGGTWSIKAVAVEDVYDTAPGGTFSARDGGVRTAYAIGSDSGGVGEFLALSALPQATPVDLEVLVRDKLDEPLELFEFCEELGCADQLEGAPDRNGFYDITIADPAGLPNRPAPLLREDACDWQPNSDRYQRVTLDNLATGQSWTVEVLTAEWGGPSASPLTFRARRGDVLQLRYNLQALGFVALLGSGITVVDLNRFYDTPLEQGSGGGAQCGRRLGRYEGAEVEFAGCGPAVLRYGIDMTPSLAVLGETGSGVETRGTGSIHTYSPLMSAGMIHASALESSPGSLDNGQLVCTRDRVAGAFHRDIALARDIEWVDRGLRSIAPGEPFTVTDETRFDRPARIRGDLLFVSVGEPGILVFEVGNRYPVLIGRLWKEGHPVYRLQVEPDLGILLAGSTDGRLDVWDLHDVNLAPRSDLGPQFGDLASPRPLATIEGVPWQTDRLAVDLSGTGLLYAWAGGSTGAEAIPIRPPKPIVAGLYRAPGATGAGPARELRPTATLVPLGVPTELSAAAERDNRERNEERFTAAFKVRLALPGALGDKVGVRVESLRAKPPEEMTGADDLGPMRMPKGGGSWPDPYANLTLKRLAGTAANVDGRFGQAFNLYESEEIVLLLADPRAMDDYVLQGAVGESEAPTIDSEAGQCRRCGRPGVLTGEDEVVEMLAAGRWLRVVLDVDSVPGLADVFGGDGVPIPAAVVELAGWADDVPSPQQASLAEPPLGAAGWSPGEGGVAASLFSGESLYSSVDHSVAGRALGFTFERSYRSGLLGYNSLGAAGWTANLFAHLRHNPITGEVAYHDGAGNVWRFFPVGSEPGVDGSGLALPDASADGDFWAVAGRYEDPKSFGQRSNEPYMPPKGLYLQLRTAFEGGGWVLLGPHNDAMTFDGEGRLIQIADRLRQNAADDEIRGNRVRLFYDAFGRLARVEDDYRREYRFTYNEDDPENLDFGLLESIEDFAKRTVTYGYQEDSRVLEIVTLPEVTSEALMGDEDTTPEITYAYDGGDYADGILHDALSGSRLESVRLPGRDENRFDLAYENGSGRLEFVGLPGMSKRWRLKWALGDGRVDAVNIFSPHTETESRSVYDLHTEGPDRGRLHKVIGQNVPYVPSGWYPAEDAEDLAPATMTSMLEVEYEYTDDGSGRVKTVKTPTDADAQIEYRTGSTRVAELGVDLVKSEGTDVDGEAEISVTIDPRYELSVDNYPSVIVDGRGREQLVSPPAIAAGQPPADVVRGFPGENILSTLEYSSTGTVELVNLGTSAAKSDGAGLQQIGFEYSASEPSTDNGEGYLEKITRGAGPTTRLTDRDAYGNPTRVTTSAGDNVMTSKSLFDAWDRAYETTVAPGGGEGVEGTVTTRYDASGRPVETTRTQKARGTITTTTQYNERGQVTQVTTTGHADETVGTGANQSLTTKYDYDPDNGLLKSVTRAFGTARASTVEFDHDSEGRVTTITLPPVAGQEESTILHRGYDEMGRVVYTTDGDEGWWRGTYNELGQLAEERLADGTVVKRSYDDAGILEQVDVHAPARNGAEPVTVTTRYEVTGSGRIEKVFEDGLFTGEGLTTRVTGYDYDEVGRVTTIERGPTDGPFRTERTVTYRNDQSGRVDTVEDAFGNTVTYDYKDDRPWPWRVTTSEITPDGGPPIVRWEQYGRDDRGRPRTITTSEGLTVTREYDEEGNVLREHLGAPSKDTWYAWDGWGNLLSVRRPLIGSLTEYGYDIDGNLKVKRVGREAGAFDTTTFDYDLHGLLKSRTLPGPDAITETFEYEPDGQLRRWATRQTNDADSQLTLIHQYDPINRLTRRYIENAAAFAAEGLPNGLLPFDEVGDSSAYDGLGRVLQQARIADLSDDEEGGTADVLDESSRIGYGYMLGDPRALPQTETIGADDAIVRDFDIYDRMTRAIGPAGHFAIQNIGYDDLDRRTMIEPLNGGRFAATYRWGGTGRFFGLTAGSLDQSYAYDSTSVSQGSLLSAISTIYGGGAFEQGGSLGGYLFSWVPGSGVKQGRGPTDLEGVFSGTGWQWTVDDVHRLRQACAGNGEAGGELPECTDNPLSWTYQNLGRADELLSRIDNLGTRTTASDFETSGRVRTLTHTDADGNQTTETLSYDRVGRRTSDAAHTYNWSWRGELREVGEADGSKVVYSYDAAGRLLTRTHLDDEGSFLSKRQYHWNGAELLAQVGLNFEDVALWRVEHLPGPVGLDDSPQLRVTTGLNSDEQVTRIFDLVRDEMGTVVAVFEDIPGPIDDQPLPPLKARILYDPYGHAHIETGPELRVIEHDPDVTTVGDVEQAALDGGPPENPVIGIAGTVVVATSMALDPASLEAGLSFERWDDDAGAWVDFGPGEAAIAQDEDDLTRLQLMPVEGWLEGERYRVTLTAALTDSYGRAFVVPGGGGAFSVTIEVLAEVGDTDAALPGLPREIPLTFDTVAAASATLDCDGEPCLPGGLNLLFQGLWSDPVTGIAYARNRWYDARTAMWLSEDPLEDVDSPNLYAFVGWGPQAATDPLGLGAALDINSSFSTEIDAIQKMQAELLAWERRAALEVIRAQSLAYLDQFPKATLADEQYKRQLLYEYFCREGIGGGEETRAALVGFVLGPMGLNPDGDPAFEMMSQIGRYGDDIEGIAFFVVEVSMGMGAVEVAGPLARVAENFLARSALGKAIRAQIARTMAAKADNALAYQGGFARIDALLPFADDLAKATGKAYNKATGQGLYVLVDDAGEVLYVGRGDVPVRLKRHYSSLDKGHLSGRLIWENNLTKGQAKGLEQALIDYFGGARSTNPVTNLINRIRAIGPRNPNAAAYNSAVTPELFEETIRRIGIPQ